MHPIHRFILLALITCCWSGSIGAAQATPQLPTAENLEPVVTKLLAGGQQGDAESLLLQSLDQHASVTASFLLACCERSRFDIDTSALLFTEVAQQEPTTARGRCARLILTLDQNKRATGKFTEFRTLVDHNLDDPFLIWMLAVQCRTRNESELGITYFSLLATRWQPGPVMLHQTMANVLDEEGRSVEALPHRFKAVAQESKVWTLSSLGDTFMQLNRIDEAYSAYAAGSAMDPKSTEPLSGMAIALFRDGRFQDAIDLIQRSEKSGLMPDAQSHLGDCYVGLEQRDLARAAFSKQLSIDPSNLHASGMLSDLVVGSITKTPYAAFGRWYDDLGVEYLLQGNRYFRVGQLHGTWEYDDGFLKLVAGDFTLTMDWPMGNSHIHGVDHLNKPVNLYRRNARDPEDGFTPWMDQAALARYFAPKDAKDDKGIATFWTKNAGVAVEGRWLDGDQYRVRVVPIPAGLGLGFQWYFGLSLDVFQKKCDELGRQGFRMNGCQSFTRPDGTTAYQGCWITP